MSTIDQFSAASAGGDQAYKLVDAMVDNNELTRINWDDINEALKSAGDAVDEPELEETITYEEEEEEEPAIPVHVTGRGVKTASGSNTTSDIDQIASEIEKSPDTMTHVEKEAALAVCRMTIKHLHKQLIHKGFQIEVSEEDLTSNDLTRVRNVMTQLNACWQVHMWTSVAQEVVVKCASVIERVFNGKREVFGIKPDLRGYATTAYGIANSNQHVFNGFVSSHVISDPRSGVKSLAVQLAMAAMVHQSAGVNVNESQAQTTNVANLVP